MASVQALIVSARRPGRAFGFGAQSLIKDLITGSSCCSRGLIGIVDVVEVGRPSWHRGAKRCGLRSTSSAGVRRSLRVPFPTPLAAFSPPQPWLGPARRRGHAAARGAVGWSGARRAQRVGESGGRRESRSGAGTPRRRKVSSWVLAAPERVLRPPHGQKKSRPTSVLDAEYERAPSTRQGPRVRSRALAVS